MSLYLDDLTAVNALVARLHYWTLRFNKEAAKESRASNAKLAKLNQERQLVRRELLRYNVIPDRRPPGATGVA